MTIVHVVGPQHESEFEGKARVRVDVCDVAMHMGGPPEPSEAEAK